MPLIVQLRQALADRLALGLDVLRSDSTLRVLPVEIVVLAVVHQPARKERGSHHDQGPKDQRPIANVTPAGVFDHVAAVIAPHAPVDLQAPAE